MVFPIVIIDRQFRRASDLNQGMFDRAFAAYLVKHAPVASDTSTGWSARLDSMGDWGDRLAQRQAERQEKAAAKAATKAAEAAAEVIEQAAAEETAEAAEDSDDEA